MFDKEKELRFLDSIGISLIDRSFDNSSNNRNYLFSSDIIYKFKSTDLDKVKNFILKYDELQEKVKQYENTRKVLIEK